MNGWPETGINTPHPLGYAANPFSPPGRTCGKRTSQTPHLCKRFTTLIRHVVNGESLHADFLEVSMTRKMRVGIPIKLIGDPVGVTAGGVLDQQMRELEVECLPGDLVEFVTVDVSGLAIGQTVTVSQVQVDPKLHVLASGNQAVASVLAPMAEEEVAPEAAAEGTEPELIKKPVKEGEEGEATAADEKGAKAPAEKAGAKPEKADKAAKPEKKESKSKG